MIINLVLLNKSINLFILYFILLLLIKEFTI